MKKFLTTYENVLNLVMEKFTAVLLIMIGILLCLVIWLQVFARMFMSLPPDWTEELSRILFIWFGILGSSYTLWKREHMCLDILYLKLGFKGKRLMACFADTCVFIMGFIMFYYGLGLLKITSIHLTSILRWPMWIFYAVLPICGFFYMVVSVLEILRIFILGNVPAGTDPTPEAGG